MLMKFKFLDNNYVTSGSYSRFVYIIPNSTTDTCTIWLSQLISFPHLKPFKVRLNYNGRGLTPLFTTKTSERIPLIILLSVVPLHYPYHGSSQHVFKSKCLNNQMITSLRHPKAAHCDLTKNESKHDREWCPLPGDLTALLICILISTLLLSDRPSV